MRIHRADLHIHATRYRAVGPKWDVTVSAVLQRCAASGVEYAGVLEHLSRNGPKHPLSCLLELAAEFRACEHPIPASLGAEVNIIDTTGELDATEADREAAGLDFVLAGIHYTPPEVTTVRQCVENDLRAIVAAIERNPWVDAIAHPWRPARRARLRQADEPWSFALVPESVLVELADALGAHRTACEVHYCDVADFADAAYHHFIDVLLNRRVPLAIASDTHGLEGIGRTKPIYEFLEARRVPGELIWLPKS